MPPSPPDSMSVESLAEEFLDRLRRGEHPRIDDYAERYPALAHEIREFFPALRLVEDFKPDSHDEPVAAKRVGHGGSIPDLLVRAPERLGDFRVLREISRGGMGIVYEAVQESLGRSVALKVLPPHALPDARQKKRFVREARAAARLHHTNIVPVFGVGDADGIHYYAMQFIQGLGLDQVLDELRRLRAAGPQPASLISRGDAVAAAGQARSDPLSDQFCTGKDVSAVYVAQSLVSGRFVLEHLPNACDVSSSNSGSSGGSLEPTQEPDSDSLPLRVECGNSPQSDNETTAKRLSDTAAYVLQGRDASNSGRGALSAYWRSVARIGVQVGEALQYAHDHRVLHRDIKPSNLLLDAHGTAWVTDFGLAKADDQDDLTRTGDVLGTLRYTAPELFHGKADCRSDVYSLGLTLYELLAMRPAFDETNRHKLVSQVMHQSPSRLRDVDRHIPRDLETIVDKAIDRDPSRRYQTAGEFADDLKRFLGNEPIKARRASYVTRSARWCKRNPSLAGLFAILVLMAIISPLAALRFGRLAAERSEAAAAALNAKQDAVRQLYFAKRAEAKASRFSGRSGQRFASLAALFAARQLPIELAQSVEEIADIRDEVIACLVVPDLYARRQWPAPRSLTKLETIHFDRDLEHYVSLDEDALTVRRTSDNIELARLPVQGGVPETARFSPDGRFVALCYHQSDHDWLRIWDWKTGEIVLAIPDRVREFAIDFSPDSKYFAAGGIDSTVTVYDLTDGHVAHRFVAASPPFAVHFHPADPVIAVSCEAAFCVQIWDFEEPEIVRTLEHPSEVYGFAWHPTGDYLAAAEGHRIHLWRVSADAAAPLRILDDTTYVVHDLQFHPNGRILYSHCWREGKTRVWDPFRGDHLLMTDGHFSTISLDGRRMAFRTSKHVGIWDVATRDACCRPFAYDRNELGVNACDYSDDGQWLAVAFQSGVQIWDTAVWQPIVHIPMAAPTAIRFEALSRSLLVSTDSGLFRWPIEWSQTSRVRIGPPEKIELPPELIPSRIALSQDRRTSIVELVYPPWGATSDQAIFIGRSGRQFLLREPKLRYVSLSPDGRLAAVGNWEGSGASIWDAVTAKRLRQLPTVGNTVVRFTPDGRRLVTATPTEVSFWDVATWQPVHTIAKPGIGFGDAISFTRDGRYMAMTATQSMIQLVDVASGQVVASLEADESPALVKSIALSPTGGQLAMCCYGDGLRVWDLRYIREQLRQENLDWDDGPLPKPPTQHPGSIKVEVDRGELEPVQRSS